MSYTGVEVWRGRGRGLLTGDHRFVKYFWEVKKSTCSIGLHSLIICTQKRAFLRRVCDLLSTLFCICCKTGIPKLRARAVGGSSLSSPELLESQAHPPSVLGVLLWKGIVFAVVFVPSLYFRLQILFRDDFMAHVEKELLCLGFFSDFALLGALHIQDLHRIGHTSFSCVSQPNRL